jgi:hypothetical protein
MADEGEADLARLRPIIQLTARKTERDRGHWALMRLSRNAECKEPADSNAHVNELGLRGDLVLISVVSIALVSAMGRKRTLREWQEWVESGRGPPPPPRDLSLAEWARSAQLLPRASWLGESP